MTPETPTILNEEDVKFLRGVVDAAAKVITSDKPAFQKLIPYAAHIVRIALLELRRNERAVKATAAKPAAKKR